jgi:integrase
MARIKFFTRTITKDKKALVPIYVRVIQGRGIDLVSKADILIKPGNWSNKTQQASQKADVFKFFSGESNNEQQGRQKFNNEIMMLRTFIESELMKVKNDDLISRSQGIKQEGKQRKKEVSKWLDITIDKYWHPEKYEENLFTYIQKFVDNSGTRINTKTGRPVCYKMQREYEVTFDYLKKYATKTGKKIDFKDINMEFYNGFTEYLQGEKLAVNTIGKKIQTLKIFLNSAKEENKNSYEAYKSKKFVATTEEADTIYLNEDELTKIYEHDFSKTPGLDRVRDLFLVGCWTGCRFSDIAQIKPESISEGLIHLKQFKTGTRVIIPLHPVVTAILNKYKGSLPEAITNQKFNEALKEIAQLSEINERTHKTITRGGVKKSTAYEKWELVTTHTARRSFATNLYKSGFPTLSIMAITGHTTEKSFLKYIKVTPDEHAKKLQVHWNKSHLKVV